ncbi:hypothetical protein HY375_02485 [Candidatus Berkelbacteria bacterium]|nr:hypothetical protein [Candidatus Berkelbacteria bacterium]
MLVLAGGTAAYVATQAGVFGEVRNDRTLGEELLELVEQPVESVAEPAATVETTANVAATLTPTTTNAKTPVASETNAPTSSEPTAATPAETPAPEQATNDQAKEPSGEHGSESGESSSPPASSPGNSQEQTSPPASSTPTCQSNASPTFTHHITDLTKVSQVIPPPTKAGTDLKPHGYVDTQLTSVPVYAPIVATLDSGAYYQEGNPGGEYLLIFRVSCEVTFRFDHITGPIQSIKDAFPIKQSDTRTTAPTTSLSFAAGEQIATTTGTIYGIWDFGVYNTTVSNRYASDPAWNWSDNATTAVCPWGYYSSTMYAQYKALFGSLSGNPPHGESFCR